MFKFLEFSGSYKKFCNFLRLFFIIASVLSICFFSDLNLQKKQIKNAVKLKTQAISST